MLWKKPRWVDTCTSSITGAGVIAGIRQNDRYAGAKTPNAIQWRAQNSTQQRSGHRLVVSLAEERTLTNLYQ